MGKNRGSIWMQLMQLGGGYARGKAALRSLRLRGKQIARKDWQDG